MEILSFLFLVVLRLACIAMAGGLIITLVYFCFPAGDTGTRNRNINRGCSEPSMWIMALIGAALWQSEARKHEPRWQRQSVIPTFFQGKFFEVEYEEDAFFIDDKSITWRNLYDGSKKVIEADFVWVSKDTCVLGTSEGEELATITYDAIEGNHIATLITRDGYERVFYLWRGG